MCAILMFSRSRVSEQTNPLILINVLFIVMKLLQVSADAFRKLPDITVSGRVRFCFHWGAVLFAGLSDQLPDKWQPYLHG